jgi:hypothetical protein
MKNTIRLLILLICVGSSAVSILFSAEYHSSPETKDLKGAALFDYLIGTWVSDEDEGGNKFHTEQTFHKDGTFTGEIKIEGPITSNGVPSLITFQVNG